MSDSIRICSLRPRRSLMARRKRRSVQDVPIWAMMRGIHFYLGEFCFGVVGELDARTRGCNVDVEQNVGWILDAESRPLTPEALHLAGLRFPVAEIRAALEDLSAHGLLVVRADGALGIPNWLDPATRRKRRQRRRELRPTMVTEPHETAGARPRERDNEPVCHAATETGRDIARDSHALCHAQSHAPEDMSRFGRDIGPVCHAQSVTMDALRSSSSSSKEEERSDPDVRTEPSRSLLRAFAEQLCALFASIFREHLPSNTDPETVDDAFLDALEKRQREHPSRRDVVHWERTMTALAQDNFWIKRRRIGGVGPVVPLTARELVTVPGTLKKGEGVPPRKVRAMPAASPPPPPSRQRELPIPREPDEDIVPVGGPEMQEMIDRALGKFAPAALEKITAARGAAIRLRVEDKAYRRHARPDSRASRAQLRLRLRGFAAPASRQLELGIVEACMTLSQFALTGGTGR